MQGEAKKLLLPVGILSGIVLVLIVAIELGMFAYREQGASVEVGGTPFVVLTLVERLGCNVWHEMVRANGKGPLELQFVPVSPGETAVLPIKVGTVSVREQKPRSNWKAKGHSLNCPIFGRCVWCGDYAVPALQDQRPRFHVIQVKS